MDNVFTCSGIELGLQPGFFLKALHGGPGMVVRGTPWDGFEGQFVYNIAIFVFLNSTSHCAIRSRPLLELLRPKRGFVTEIGEVKWTLAKDVAEVRRFCKHRASRHFQVVRGRFVIWETD